MLTIVFCGNSKYSVIVAKALDQKFRLSLIVTSPDRPIGRGKKLTPNLVKTFGLQNNIPVVTTDKLDQKAAAEIAKVKPDFLVVADYGLIIPNVILKLPKYAPLNVHHSLLPKYRGPSPAPNAILNGEQISGVTIIRMTEKVDAGDILAQKTYPLKKEETTDSLLTQLNTLGGEIIVPVIENYAKGQIKATPQDETKATLTKRLTKDNGYIDLIHPPSLIFLDRMIRAYYPWPGVWSRLPTRSHLVRGETSQGKIVKFLPEKRIQVEGGKPMTVKDFLNGYPEAKEQFLQLLSVSA